MAVEKVTGWTKEDVARERHEHPDDHEYDFEEFYCLTQINRQPPDYDGPPRYCAKYTLLDDDFENGRRPSCRFHKRNIEDLPDEGRWEEGDVTNMKHGMYAEDENLKDDFSEADEKLFEKIMGWAEDFGFEEGSPAYTQLESLALSKVREMRAEKYLNENGELVEREAWNPEKEELETWEEVHPLSDQLRLKKQTIVDMMKELGLTPKAQSQMDAASSEGNAMDAFAEMAESALDDDEAEYDPSEFGESE